ncbi:UDP-2,4-diacetamido-2,4,6-trideoxy-beta-L-altropyranose hydrolase [Polaribacter aestuariivivens]|uniref:UDP-2,4-diacetamido-2,4, 6-trideoxy-beta-L-altropyranose hydrolase n=1 Tax=Polaribacter aestuariivivens TaxID=2304626 RepID=A0A5S3N262_9FLAO|nr:UDP-2,4-diacetamido-2,4,6-trideoxy-beta-L-altropyranose hydrolase [Polaribacter aestuariivivens]TMM29157.1 UDP-2,4-diacetamido-2,4,6-trideoxy-beta-L-altropyranose hydrolase [Polaribacter aestuariivivens]
MTKKIIFRADGNSNIGLGHLFRLFALIEMYKEHYECIFVTKENSTLSVFSKKHNLVILPKNINIYEESNWLAENFSPNEHCIILDGYQFNFSYQKKIKKVGFKLVFIDDNIEKEIAADIVVNHSLFVTEAHFGTHKNVIFGLGSKYAILRPLFLEESKRNREIKTITKVFICFGGADFNNLTHKCLNAIVEFSDFKEIHIVLGSAYKQKEIYRTIEQNCSKVFLHKKLDEKEMIGLMKKCDFAIVPSSTISYEVCAVNMIILSGYYIDNQLSIYKGLINNSLIYSAGNFNEMDEVDFKNKILEVINDSQENYKIMLENQKHFFDGMQKSRFLELTKELLC